MSVIRQEKTVTVEKWSDSSETNATATENGKTGAAKGGTAEEALGRTRDEAKQDRCHLPPFGMNVGRR